MPSAIRLSLESVDQVVEQDAQTAPGSRPETADDLGEVVGSVEQLDDDAFDAQVVAPHLLDELGVVTALDQDAAGPGDAGGRTGHGDGARRRPPGSSSARERREGGPG